MSKDPKFASDNAYIKIVENNTKLVAQQLPTEIARALEMVGIVAEGDVIGYMTQQHIVDTGRLRNSITHAIINKSNEAVAVVGTNVSYAGYVHNGTSKMKARPFLTAPVSKNASKYRDILKKELSS